MLVAKKFLLKAPFGFEIVLQRVERASLSNSIVEEHSGDIARHEIRACGTLFFILILVRWTMLEMQFVPRFFLLLLYGTYVIKVGQLLSI